MPDLCPRRKELPHRPKPWYDENMGFTEFIVLQCEFCKEQVRYQKVPMEESNVGSGFGTVLVGDVPVSS